MHAAVKRQLTEASVFIAAAAVADYRPVTVSRQKIKKGQSTLTLQLERTPDILQDVSEARRDGLLVIGFAAESENVLSNAQAKLRSKNLDAIVANDITREGVGFDTETNEVTIISRHRKAPIHVPLMSKVNVANIILDEVARLRAGANKSVTQNIRKPRQA
jgi:phosphopantothenoylcysteine decarboxylase/phosphopantothenate--cysteine ligase